MGIEFTKATKNFAFVRPTGYLFPAGLSANTSVDYLIVAGGGGGAGTTPGGTGGSGIIIVRYSGSQQATGGTITANSGYTIHTFTGDGTLRYIAYSIN